MAGSNQVAKAHVAPAVRARGSLVRRTFPRQCVARKSTCAARRIPQSTRDARRASHVRARRLAVRARTCGSLCAHVGSLCAHAHRLTRDQPKTVDKQMRAGGGPPAAPGAAWAVQMAPGRPARRPPDARTRRHGPDGRSWTPGGTRAPAATCPGESGRRSSLR